MTISSIYFTFLSMTEIVFREAGSGAPVLLLHGVPGSARDWDGVADRLRDRHRVLAPDLLGFGASSRPRTLRELWADRQAEALAAALDDLGARPAVVAGHDFGGPVALHLARRRPDLAPALVLSATNVFPDTPIPFPLSMTTWPVVGDLAARVLFSGPALLALARRRDAVGDAGQQRSIRTVFTGALRDLPGLYSELEHDLLAFAGPVQVVWGDRDPFFALDHGRRTAEAAGAELTVLEGAGHFLPVERPDDYAGAIARAMPVTA